EPARLPRPAARTGVRPQNAVVLFVHPAQHGPAAAQRPSLAGRSARRLHRPRAVPAVNGATESVAVVVVTYNRADLLARMLAGLAGLETAPDAVYVVDNASTDHTADVLDQAANPGLVRLR